MIVNGDLKIAQDLRATADYLRRNGWTKGEPLRTDGRACLIGALGIASGTWVLSGDLELDLGRFPYHKMLQHYKALGFSGPVGAFSWNDQCYARDEVLDRLEATALALEIHALAHTMVSEPVSEPVLELA